MERLRTSLPGVCEVAVDPGPADGAMASTVNSLDSYICRAEVTLSGDITSGRPPWRSRALVRPTWVRSRIGSRSNSARAPKRWKTSLPLEVREQQP